MDYNSNTNYFIIMNKSNAQLIDLLDDWFKNIYQEVYHERGLNKCKDLDKAEKQWKMISHDNDDNSYVFENTYLKKSAQIVDDYVIGFFSKKDFVFFLHYDADGQIQVEIGDFEYFQKNGARSDWHISEVAVTPEFLDEVCEGSFYSEEGLENTRKGLLKLGFIEDEEFSKLMSCHYAPATTIVKINKMK